MSNPSSDSFRNVYRYTGQDYSFVARYLRPRDPTSADIKPKENQGHYPLGSVWTNYNSQTVSSNKLWILLTIVKNLATWVLISSGGSGPIIGISPPLGVTPIVANPSTGLINFTSSGGSVQITGSAASPNNHTINFDVNVGASVTQLLANNGFTAVPDNTGSILIRGGAGITTAAQDGHGPNALTVQSMTLTSQTGGGHTLLRTQGVVFFSSSGGATLPPCAQLQPGDVSTAIVDPSAAAANFIANTAQTIVFASASGTTLTNTSAGASITVIYFGNTLSGTWYVISSTGTWTLT